jgi:electron transfer flavoprotein alpha subunit
MSIPLLAIAEQRNGRIRKTSFEVVRKAREIADELGGTLTVLVIGAGIDEEAKSLGRYGAGEIITVNDDTLSLYSTTGYAKAAAGIIKKEQSQIVFLPATAFGKDLAPYLAVQVDGAVAADCVDLRVENGEIIATRPVYAGKALIDVAVNAPVRIYTLRPNVFSAGDPDTADGNAAVREETIGIGDADLKSRVTAIVETSKGRLDVTEADRIVSGGRGLKGPEHFHLIEELAEVLGAAVGASRAVVDAGWRPHDEQVGQTGKTVSPQLYIAVGISGAVQHLAGMSSSKYIVAINKDKDAPIFQIADYGIVGDALEIVPALKQELMKTAEK